MHGEQRAAAGWVQGWERRWERGVQEPLTSQPLQLSPGCQPCAWLLLSFGTLSPNASSPSPRTSLSLLRALLLPLAREASRAKPRAAGSLWGRRWRVSCQGGRSGASAGRGREGTARAATATRGTARLSTREPARHSSGHCFSQDTRFLVLGERFLLVSHHVPTLKEVQEGKRCCMPRWLHALMHPWVLNLPLQTTSSSATCPSPLPCNPRAGRPLSLGWGRTGSHRLPGMLSQHPCPPQHPGKAQSAPSLPRGCRWVLRGGCAPGSPLT